MEKIKILARAFRNRERLRQATDFHLMDRISTSIRARRVDDFRHPEPEDHYN
jgi:hypothetical protein